MNKKIILGVVGVAVVLGGAIGARIAIQPKGANGPAISLYVGDESGNVSFYQQVCNEFVKQQNEAEAGSFPFSIKVSGVDLGSIAGPIQQDNTAHADIYSVANDNIGKLAQGGKARVINDESLISQVQSDNSADFYTVCQSEVQGVKGLYGVPYISQALFLMYNSAYVSDEQAKSFEGLAQAAAAVGSSVKAVEVTGTDGFNFSFSILARNNETKTSSLKLYADQKNNTRAGTDFQGDDMIAITKWMQHYFANPNGLGFPSDAGWNLDLQNHSALALIGGAWHFNAFAQAVGSSNAKATLLPTFTLGADDAFGAVQAGDVYRGGSFCDAKVFMVNQNCSDEKYPYAQKLIKYLSSIDVQKRSFAEVGNIPSYAAFSESIDALVAENPDIPQRTIDLAKAQTGMTPYGLPQPFINAKMNNYYYQNSAPSVYQEMIVNAADKKTGERPYDTDREIQEGHYVMQYIWQRGKRPSEIPATLPAFCVDA